MKNSIDSSIELQINKIFESLDQNVKLVKTSFILSKLDLSIIEIDQRDSIYNPYSLAKLYLYKRIKGIFSYEKLIELKKEEAFELGFLNDENNNLQLLTKRAFNKFFQNKISKEAKLQLDKIAKEILRIATNKGIILDIDLVNKTLNKYKNNNEEKRKIFHETTKLVKKLIYPQINIKIKNNGKFTTKDLLDILVHVALTHDFCNNGCKTFQELYSDKNVPNGDTLLYHFNKLKARDEIEETFNNIFDIIFNFAKSSYKILQTRKVDIAIDIHDIPYYGNKSDNFVIGGKQENGTNNFFKFITCSIVVAGKRFTIGAFPIHPLDNLQELLDKLLKGARSKVKIRYVYLDRGFDNSLVLKVLKQNKLKYLMPKVRTLTVKSWYRKSQDCKSRIIENFKIGNEETTLVLVDDEEGIKRAFSTNIKISEPIAFYLFKLYKARWGIETAYRQLEHDFKAKTTSKNYNIRLFYFLFSICLFNLWILVNICVSLSLYKRISEKPIITAKLFAIVLYKLSIDPGGE